MATQKVLDVEYLNKLKLEDLKRECSSRSLHISGTKPVLIGRILDFQQTGDASASNKRSNDELKAINEKNPSKKAKNMSETMRLLEKHKTKKWYMQTLTDNKAKFQEINAEILGNNHPQFVLDVSGACLELPYDSLTLDKFVEQTAVLAPKYESANFYDHKYANKDFWSKISFPNLKVLCLQQDNLKLNDEDLAAALKACPALQALDLHNNKFVGDGLQNIHVTNPSLSWIWLSNTMDINKVMPHLSKCPNLKTIVGFHLFSIDDHIIEMLVSMPKLVKCRVPYKPLSSREESKITEKGMAMLLTKSFDLQDFPASTLISTASSDTTQFKPKGRLGMEDLKKYLAKCPNLTSIDLEMCKFTDDINKALAEIAQAPCAAKIENINLTGYEAIRNEGLQELGKLRALQSLGLGFAWQGQFGDRANLSEDLFVETSKNWKDLRKLEIQFSPITTTGMKDILSNCPKLASLDMTGCGGEMEDYVTMHYEMMSNPTLKRKGLHIIHEKR